MTTMTQRHYTIRFLTPAFLGNAEQVGEWRTPPFKALLRQWWRVAAAEECGFDSDRLRSKEAAVFGSVNGDDGRRSQVRIRLRAWETGKLRDWNGLDTGKVDHPEVRGAVGAQLYLGYGPLISRNGTALKAKAAIQAGESNEIRFAFPAACAPQVDFALALMDLYGTAGGRSRNGWGSFQLSPLEGTPAFAPRMVGRDWRKALALDWPHAIGFSEGAPLIWQTEVMADWQSVMKRLAKIKIGLRTQFAFPAVRPPHPQPLDRHWLSYPITNHGTAAWDRNARLPNSLRFKVRADGDGGLRGVVFHVPCLPPAQFRPDRNAIESVWQRVHSFLDAPGQNLTRIGI